MYDNGCRIVVESGKPPTACGSVFSIITNFVNCFNAKRYSTVKKNAIKYSLESTAIVYKFQLLNVQFLKLFQHNTPSWKANKKCLWSKSFNFCTPPHIPMCGNGIAVQKKRILPCFRGNSQSKRNQHQPSRIDRKLPYISSKIFH